VIDEGRMLLGAFSSKRKQLGFGNGKALEYLSRELVGITAFR
jgi:hypothetical protein